MKMRLVISMMTVMLSGTFMLNGQNAGSTVTDVILAGYTARIFTTNPVTDSEIDLIVKCGLQAPSARNSQLWKFTVVKDNSLIEMIIPNTTSGNVLIVVSGMDAEQQGVNVDFDCALATENMYIAAQGLGLGAHIYASPVNTINTTLKEILEIPEDYRAIAVVRIGNIDNNIDAVSSASTRKQLEEVVNYK